MEMWVIFPQADDFGIFINIGSHIMEKESVRKVDNFVWSKMTEGFALMVLKFSYSEKATKISLIFHILFDII